MLWYTLLRYFMLCCGCLGVLGLACIELADVRVGGLVLINVTCYSLGFQLIAQQRRSRYHALCHHARLPVQPLVPLAWSRHTVALVFTVLWLSIGICLMLLPQVDQRLLGLLTETLLAPLPIRWMASVARHDAFTQALKTTPAARHTPQH